ncbi:ComEA family DNA-binding protein [Sulfurirhabdus autotrophica]|uniref:Competence protein ComEA n=1 Tax=Sulfurirhabdus autotrophica TaxID=1706046 RepID=A0A4R3YDE7_9PROT|nr:helix-hairpin-helix domain-containing protein [Sulfurirhabdus autotrophica]TCV90515.1 competence protein ComEA [Sulfurirhabdus autotrophica]
MNTIFIVIALCCLFVSPVFAAPVDINTSSRTHLESVPGIGPGKAKAIIAYRKEHGPFKNVDELDNVAGIGPKTIDKIRSKITASKPKVASDSASSTNKIDSAGNWKGVIR